MITIPKLLPGQREPLAEWLRQVLGALEDMEFSVVKGMLVEAIEKIETYDRR